MKRDKISYTRILLALADVFYMAVVSMALNIAIYSIDTIETPKLLSNIRTATAVNLAFIFVAEIMLLVFGNYKTILRYSGVGDMLRIVASIGVSLFISVAAALAFCRELVSYALVVNLLYVSIIVLIRMIYIYFVHKLKSLNPHDLLAAPKGTPTLIIGAGEAGTILVNELNNASDKYYPIYFADDDPNKIGLTINKASVVGPTMLLPDICKKYCIKTIFIAIPSLPEDKMQILFNECLETKCDVRILPHIASLAVTKPLLAQSKVINYSSLLGRKEIVLEKSNIENLINGNTVVVTGGGGSIGSELCRQISEFGPKKLVIIDIYENNAYDIQQDLIMKNPFLDLSIEIASVRDYDKMDAIFKKYRPQVVFHAAAHKHVPLMESNPEEAVKNNIGGTYNVARIAIKYGAKRFVMISTDKAVNPTNVMGATKRCCEMIVQHLSNTQSDTCFAMVRFGNVLGSNGSVIPLFKKQIESGGPVKVTHPDIVRYFMTIPEAVNLVLQAGAMAKGGEVFVLNMGEAVKIVTLAENVIKFYGLRPYIDIPIEFTGLRPGEKLYEELLMSEEGLVSTKNEKIFIGKQIDVDSENFVSDLENILAAADNNDSDRVVELLKKTVTTFHRENA